MQQNFDDIRVLCGKLPKQEQPAKPMQPFEPMICDFLSALSERLMQHSKRREFPDILTFGFFCRRANLTQLRARYGDSLENRIGRGMSFHIAPSNVPIMFAYSAVASLLAGNTCVVRASAKDFPQTEIICAELRELLEQPSYSALNDRIAIVQYPHSRSLNDLFSSMCAVRIIWGGDRTVSEVRQSPLPPRACELTFADRYSAAVFDAEAVLSAGTTLARDFYNDTYLYDQNACSSPRLIYWLGKPDVCSHARTYFWDMLHTYVRAHYPLEPVISVDKFTAACRLAVSQEARMLPMPDLLISRAEVSSLSSALQQYVCAGGSFIEYHDTALDALASLITPKVQTIAYYGDLSEMLGEFTVTNQLSGIDRIVPVGKTADFDLLWDGYDLITQMSRVIAVR